jgi:uncharacterized protein DUF6883
MKLPGIEQAIIDSRKIREYILSPSHPVGRFKAAFFEKLGFTEGNWWDLEVALRKLSEEGEAEVLEHTRYGQKYRIRGILEGPTGARAAIASIWIIRDGERVPRLITVMPER